ncbi:MAG: hypothetical protein RIT81_16720 [Deltaproteobacteria bacterium]
MATHKNRIRNVAISVGVVVIGALFASSLLDDNPERRRLEERKRQLDARLVRHRAIAHNLERYRRETKKLEARKAQADRFLSPDFEAFAAALPEGTTLKRSTSTSEGAYLQHPFEISGPASELAEAWSAIAETGLLLEASKFELRDEGWGLVGAAFEFQAAAPSRAEEVEDEEPWYGSVNDDLREELADKEAEIEELEQKIGEVARFVPINRQLEERLMVIENLRMNRPDIRPVVASLVVGAEAPCTAVDAVANDARTVRVDARGEATREQLSARLPKAWALTQFETSDAGALTLEFRRAAE